MLQSIALGAQRLFFPVPRVDGDAGRDAFAFEGLDSPYLQVAEDLRVRTPYSRSVIAELRNVPWACWDSKMKAWRVPFRSWEELRRR